MLPAVARLPEAHRLVERGKYFVIHAPRQTGKTTTVSSLAQELTEIGAYAAALVSVEVGSAMRDHIGAAELAILGAWRSSADRRLPAELVPPVWPDAPPGQRLNAALQAWAKAMPRPLVLFVDEIDALQGVALISVLRQIRDGFQDRPASFPWS